MPPNLLRALVSLVAADVTVASLVGARVFRPELPATEVPFMPRATVVLQPSAGGFLVGADSYLAVGDQRVDVIAWGGSPGEASDVHDAVHIFLKNLVRGVAQGALVHWARPETAPLYLRDPDTEWPFLRSSWQVLVSEVEVTS